MIPYASRTGTRRNLEAMRSAGWRLILSPAGVLRTEGFPYGLDNGAWSAYQQSRSWDEGAFVQAVDLFGAGADWVVAPDIVCGGHASLDLSLRWLPRLDTCARVLIAAQDGHTPADLAPHLCPRIGVFVGGSTEWKERSAVAWGRVARARGAYLHIARVNTARRIAICAEAQADSFDGSSVSRYAANLPRLDSARKQLTIWSTK